MTVTESTEAEYDPGPVPDPPVVYSTLVVWFDAEGVEATYPHQVSTAIRYDRRRVVMTAAARSLLGRVFLPPETDDHDAGLWREAYRAIESFSWFVSADQAQLLQFTGPDALVSLLRFRVEALAPQFREAVYVVHADGERPAWHVADDPT